MSIIVKDDMRIYKHQLVMGNMSNMEGVNALSRAQFKEVLDDSIFYLKEKSVSGEKNKLLFYKALSPEKREIFRQELSSGVDLQEIIKHPIKLTHPEINWLSSKIPKSSIRYI